MSTHIHIIARASENNLSSVIRDFKKFTSGKIISMLKKENTERSLAILGRFSDAAKKHSRNEKFQVWKYNFHPEEVYSPKFTLSKIRYIHNNPIDAGLVSRPENYYYGSAGDYADKKGPVNVTLLNLHNLYY